MAALPQPVRHYLTEVAARVGEVLGDRVVGVYTTGSLALGGFQPDRSDVDLLAVAGGPVPRDTLLELARRLDHRSLECPAAGLEFVLYPLATVAAPSLAAGYLLNLNTGPLLQPVTSLDPGDGAAFWYPIDRAITRQSGAALVGLPVRQVFAPIPYDALLPVVAAAVRSHADPREGHQLDNAVLNGCRALRFAAEGRWYTKLDAAERTVPEGGPFVGLIRAAQTSFRAGRQSESGVTVAEVQAFLRHVLRRLSAAPAQIG